MNIFDNFFYEMNTIFMAFIDFYTKNTKFSLFLHTFERITAKFYINIDIFPIFV